LHILKFFWIYYLRPRKSFAKHRGKWAVVTGASFGIGYGFAVELAKRGMNVALLARSADKLKDIATELETKYKIKTKVVVVDFSSRDVAIYEQIEKQLEGLEVTMLVNNVGINTYYPKFFHEHTVEEMDNIVHVNINSANHMTRMLLPQMRSRKFGTIINLSSASALEGQPTPLFPIYAATKAYNQKFSTSLSHELERDGIEVLSINPYFVTSKMSRMRRTNILLCSETTLANETLNKLGFNMRSVIPWVNHYIQFIATTKIPYGKKTVHERDI